jgi:glucose/arabinose dehydrogenase
LKLQAIALLALNAIVLGAQQAAVPRDTVGHRWEFDAIHYRYAVEVLATGIKAPFGFAFLPDGRALLSDRGELQLSILDLSTGRRTPLTGGPVVFDSVDCGQLDVAVHPDYARNGWIYYAFTERSDTGITTIVERARIRGTALADRQRLFAAWPASVTLGERDAEELAQELWTHHGKIVRLHDDGRVPADNPFVGRPHARPEIWSLGHRNPQGLTLHPDTRQIWSTEHGPLGGDEINVIRKGANYGWPIITYGREYDGGFVGEGITQKAGLEQPVYHHSTSTAISGGIFYNGSAFPRWRGHLFIGAMATRYLGRVIFDPGRAPREERLLTELRRRVRVVKEGADGFLYVGVDETAANAANGLILRVRSIP